MLNRYSLGKNIMVLLIVAVGFLYAIPNLYGEDHAVQIKPRRDGEVTVALMDKIQTELKKANIVIKNAVMEDNQILIRLVDSEQQTLANELIGALIDGTFISAPNLLPATPDWLNVIGATPLKLGLDLRGGVHFLMEIDMRTAVEKSIESTVGGYRSDLREEDIRYSAIKRVKGSDNVSLRFRDAQTMEQAQVFLKRRYGDMTFVENNRTEEFDLL
ncbi:MAG: preprotein translocase subunit SecD, partial [Alteromonadaceae bacterium]